MVHCRYNTEREIDMGKRIYKGIKILILLCFISYIVLYGAYKAGWISDQAITSIETFVNGGTPVSEMVSTENGISGIFSSVFTTSSEITTEQDSTASQNTGTDSNSEDVEDGFVPGTNVIPELESISADVVYSDGLTVEYINVGQADCTLIYTDDAAMLIDGGNIDDGPLVSSYISSLGISEIDYAIGTHAHEDHIGGLDDIVNDFEVGYVMIPYTSPTPNGTYTYLVNAANYSGTATISPVLGATYELGDATFEILSCSAAVDTTNENEYSIVIRLKYGNNIFLFMGDAEEENETVMLSSSYDLSAEVLRVGHHGSMTSSSENFLSAVSPAYAVISCGNGNDYGHPKQQVLDRLSNIGAEILRTDQQGTIVVHSDGTNLSFAKKDTDTDSATAQVFA